MPLAGRAARRVGTALNAHESRKVRGARLFRLASRRRAAYIGV